MKEPIIGKAKAEETKTEEKKMETSKSGASATFTPPPAKVLVIHMREPKGQMLFVPCKDGMTADVLDKRIRKAKKTMRLAGRGGLSVIICEPAKTIGFVVEELSKVVEENIAAMQSPQNRIVKPKMVFPGRRGR